MFQSVPRQESFTGLSKVHDDRLTMPGFGLPLDYGPMEQNIYGVENRSLFPNSLDDRDIAKGDVDQPIQTLRELGMIKVMERITDIFDWHKKIFDPGVANAWKKEAMEGPEDITENMAQWIIEELKFKSIIYEHTGIISLYNGDVTKSDKIVPDTLRIQLSTAVKGLENVPPEMQFYNPGTKNKQQELIPVAFFPLVYGRTRILKDKLIGLDDALDSAGQGVVIPVPPETITREHMAWRVASRAGITVKPYSPQFQLLPCDLQLKDDGKWHIVSYINNLHPKRHRKIYNLVEELFNMTIPQWNATLTPLKDMLHSRARIDYRKVEYYPLPKEVQDQAPKPKPGEPEIEYEERLEAWRMQHLKAVQPDAGKFIPWAVPTWMMNRLPADIPTPVRIEHAVDLNKEYGKKGLQLFVRTMSFNLTPEDPTFDTDWQVEGQLNEHIVATMLYMIETDNIKGARIDFRHIAETTTLSEVEHRPHDTVWVKQVYGLEVGEPATQVVGGILFNQGRTIGYPSTLQHRMAGFELADKSRPGSAKAIGLFLTDPNIRIISTANVPPQRLDWTFTGTNTEELAGLNNMLDKLSMEFESRKVHMPISMNEARKLHDEVFQERIEFSKYQHVAFDSNIVTI